MNEDAEETCRRLKELMLIAKGNGNKELEEKYKFMYIGAAFVRDAIVDGPTAYMDLRLPEDLGTGYLEQLKLNKGGYSA